jgi:hypothetical protein
MPRNGGRVGAGRRGRGRAKRGRRPRRRPRPKPSYAAGLREAMDVILRPLLGVRKASRQVVWVPLLRLD